MKYRSSTPVLPLEPHDLSYIGVVGIPGVGVKSVDIRRNTNSEGKPLGNN